MRVSIISTLTILGLSALVTAAPSPVENNIVARGKGLGRCECAPICHTIPGGGGAGGTWCDCTYNGNISGCTRQNSCDSNCSPLQ